MSEEQTTKPVFSFKELIYILTLVSGFLYNNFSLKMEIHDAIATQKFNKEIVMEQMASNNKRIEGIENRMYRFECSPANKPKETKIVTE